MPLRSRIQLDKPAINFALSAGSDAIVKINAMNLKARRPD
jgi:hypothetical protein